jgi:hypothetical protein
VDRPFIRLWRCPRPVPAVFLDLPFGEFHNGLSRTESDSREIRQASIRLDAIIKICPRPTELGRGGEKAEIASIKASRMPLEKIEVLLRAGFSLNVISQESGFPASVISTVAESRQFPKDEAP